MHSASMRAILLLAAFIASVLFVLLPDRASADTWRGTAPICRGKCLPGEQQIAISDDGDGGHCFSGHKALCRNRQATCVSKETKTDCYGVVLVCSNGYNETLNGNFHTCSTYACGACLGIDSQKINPNGLAFGPDTCKQGFVWREAITNDHICVPPATRTQAADDNKAAAGRRSPNGGAFGPDTCKQGFVWREVLPSDHVCVTPTVRAETLEDNGQALQRRAAK